MKVLFVCGKGGVGKTAVAVALGRHFSQRGGALLLTINPPYTIQRHLGISTISSKPSEIDHNLYAALCQRQEILDSYIRRNLKIGFVSDWVVNHPLYQHLVTITPGLKELLILDHVFEFATTKHQNKWNTVIVDMPATGHGLNLLSITETAASAVKYGPLRRRLLNNRNKLQDPEFCRGVIVTLPEETPLLESRQLINSLQNNVSLAVDSVIVNRIEYLPMSPDNITFFDGCDDQTLVSHLTPLPTTNELPAVDSVRHAVKLQTERARHASMNIVEFCSWWQEPIVRIQKFNETEPKMLSQLMAKALIPGGYHGK